MRLEHLCLFYRKKTYPMKPSSYLILFSFLALTFSACGDDQDEKAAYDGREYLINNANHNPTTRAEYARLEFPRIKGGDNNLVVVHSTNNFGVNYALEWDVQKKSQRWSCYQMYSSNSLGGASRYYGNPQYPADPDLPSYAGWTPEDDPYYSTGYDHGHIVPSADRLCSSEANYQTFYLTNMQPMWNAFNAGLWSKMESQVRTWNRDDFRDTLYVCKGGTIDNSDQVIGTTSKGAIVPKFFYMAVLCKNSKGYKALAFWVEHLNEDRSSDNLSDYIISIDQLEERTGIDFFCNLPDPLEVPVEENVVKSAWGFK